MHKAVLALIVLSAVRVSAHDFWIEPSSFRPELGKTFTASLRVGEDFAGDPVPRSKTLLESFVVRDAAGERAINGIENQDPAGFVKIDEAGTAVIGYRSKASPLQLPPEKFVQFLTEEGIRGVTVSRQPHREHFYRFAKALVKAGNGGPANVTRPLGYRLELVPSGDPFATKKPVQLQVIYEKKPLPGTLVTAIGRDDGKRVTARSDARGRVSLDLPRGVWMIKAVHLVSAPPASGVEWESLWASLTFER
ncbi:MAG TPA: DUF4198 domain-containing protein [Thermoanaerobaculia bacterium]|jgi:uncharacterized GH25 family protein